MFPSFELVQDIFGHEFDVRHEGRGLGFYPVLPDTTKRVRTGSKKSVHDYQEKIHRRV